ncbi:MAG: Bcr/CflA family efflux MFS transporter [Alphaproteobacteria bacterium]|nr:Bcr/CflA family efflux MFS transporter [Alphaproteobacteria bacterium]
MNAPPDPAALPQSPKRHAPLWLLAIITISGTVAMHIFVPALPLVAQDFGAGIGTAQLTLGVYIAGLSVGQLTYGPISDRYGRRPVLFAGMAAYAAASLAAMLAPTIHTLIVLRFVQALGGCTGLVLGRAIVRDSTEGTDAARKLSLMNLMVMAGPGLSPVLGSLLADITGWRSIFAVLSLLGFANFLLVWRMLPETGGTTSHDARSILRSYGHLVRSRTFLGYAIGGSCATTSVYAFVSAAPFIFVNQLHRPQHEVGFYLMVNIIGAWLGSLAASRLIGRVRNYRLMVLGNALSFTCAIVLLAVALFGSLGVAAIIVPMLFLTMGAGIASPLAMSSALGVNPSIAGSASGLYGSVQMAVGAVCSMLSGLGGNPAVAVGSVLLAACVLAQLSFWLALDRRNAN